MGNIHWGDRAMCLSIPHMSKIPKGAVYRGEEGSCLPQWNEMWSRVLNRQRMPLLDATGTVIVTCLGSPRSEALAHLLRRIWYFNDVDQIACYENSAGRVVRVVVYLILSYLISSHAILLFALLLPLASPNFPGITRAKPPGLLPTAISDGRNSQKNYLCVTPRLSEEKQSLIVGITYNELLTHATDAKENSSRKPDAYWIFSILYH